MKLSNKYIAFASVAAIWINFLKEITYLKNRKKI